jgi:hypothetical protein
MLCFAAGDVRRDWSTPLLPCKPSPSIPPAPNSVGIPLASSVASVGGLTRFPRICAADPWWGVLRFSPNRCGRKGLKISNTRQEAPSIFRGADAEGRTPDLLTNESSTHRLLTCSPPSGMSCPFVHSEGDRLDLGAMQMPQRHDPQFPAASLSSAATFTR